MPRHRKSCSKCSKRYVANARMHCCDFARYAYEAFLLLFLFFTLPHIVYGIATEPATDEAQSESEEYFLVRPPHTHNEPHFLPNRTVIVQLFEWKFFDVAAECTNFLGPKGYAGVQLSPVTETLPEQSWLTRYKPISWKFATRSGSVEDFLAMSRACNAAGVRVYVDVVLNHMVGDTTKANADDPLLLGTAGSVANVSALLYDGIPFNESDFHTPCAIEDFSNEFDMRICQLNGAPDVNHGKGTVRMHIADLLNGLIELGVAGFHIDAAKYIWPSDLQDIYALVNDLNSEAFDFEPNSRPLFYQNVVDLGMDAVSKTEYAPHGIVTEYLYAAELSTIFRGMVPLSSLINWGPAMGFLPHQNALVFVDQHESQRGYLERELGKNQLLSYKQQRRYVMATAFMLAHPYGRMKRILSSYHFTADDKERGPPTVDAEEESSVQPSIRSPEFDTSEQCTSSSGWICEHRWPAIVNMLALANALDAQEDGVRDFQTNGLNHIAFCRGEKAFIAINNDAVLEFATEVQTCLEPGIYCDVISGGRKADNISCRGKSIVVKENGIADLILPAMGMSEYHAIDRDNVDDVDDDDAQWKGIAVDVDYGVIAIYIGSKLLGPGDILQNDAVVVANNSNGDSQQERTVGKDVNAVGGKEPGEKEATDGLLFATLEGESGNEDGENEESLVDSPIESQSNEAMKTNTTECDKAKGNETVV